MSRRNADYKLLEQVKGFKVGGTVEGTCGNIQYALGKKGDYSAFYDNYMSKVTAPMALARLIALFAGIRIETHGQEAYKTTWSTCLIHEETGITVTFYDWKGGFSIGSNAPATIPASLKRDVKKLLNVLVNDRCPHPYDGCVVGEIA